MSKPKSNKYRSIADKEEERAGLSKLSISFEYLDLDSEEFFIHGLESAYYRHFFDCLNRLQQSTEKEIREQTHPSLTPKSIFNGKSRMDHFPDYVAERIARKLLIETQDEDDAKARASEITKSHAFEVRVTKSQGRLHGFLWSNSFHIVWIDPFHNLHPREVDGVRTLADNSTARGVTLDGVNALRHENTELKEKCAKLERDLDEQQEILDSWIAERAE